MVLAWIRGPALAQPITGLSQAPLPASESSIQPPLCIPASNGARSNSEGVPSAVPAGKQETVEFKGMLGIDRMQHEFAILREEVRKPLLSHIQLPLLLKCITDNFFLTQNSNLVYQNQGLKSLGILGRRVFCLIDSGSQPAVIGPIQTQLKAIRNLSRVRCTFTN